MWLEAVLIGILIGIFRGGRLNQLEDLHLNGAIFILLGLLIQMVPFFLHFQWISDNAVYFTLAGLLLAFLVVVVNIRQQGMPIVALGTMLQIIVLAFNDWRMPIRLLEATSARLVQMRLAIEAGEIANDALFADATHWTRYLGKIIVLPSYYPFSIAVGVPDILIGIGVAWFVQDAMLVYRSYGRSRKYRQRRY